MHAYNTYHEYPDVGIYSFDMYYHLHYPGIVNGLQYLVFGNHIAPDQLLALPLFLLLPSAVTLEVFQSIVLALTGLVIFFIAKDLLKNEKVAMLLALAFLLNPGIWGMLIFDYHAEMFIPLFLLLTFYSMVKNRKYLFVASLLLLLGTIEVSPFIALALAISMGAYALVREKNRAVRRSWLKYSGIVAIAAVVVFLAYGFLTSYLANAYNSGQYPLLPQISMLPATTSGQFSQVGVGLSNYGVVSQFWYFRSMDGYLLYALAVILVGFGVACLFDPLFALLFVSPWLFEMLIVGNTTFLFVWYQYFSYAIGGAVCITLLTLRSLGSTDIRRSFSLLGSIKTNSKYLTLSVPICVIIICLFYPHFVRSINLNNLGQSFLFQSNSSQMLQIRQLDSLINLIPSNAPLMAPYFTMPQLFGRRYFEIIPAGYSNYTVVSTNEIQGEMWFQPEYVLADFNNNISLNSGSDYQLQNFENITANGYSLYAENGTAMLYRKS